MRAIIFDTLRYIDSENMSDNAISGVFVVVVFNVL